jgi:hypothetical protein
MSRDAGLGDAGEIDMSIPAVFALTTRARRFMNS